MANLFARKPLDKLMAEAQEVGEHSLKRSLGPINLVALGIGGIIGAVFSCAPLRPLLIARVLRSCSPLFSLASVALLPVSVTPNLLR